MKQLLDFLKTTLLGGVLLVLPAWLAVLLVVKAVIHLQVFVKPVATHLPESAAHPRVIAVLLLIAMCSAVGLFIQTPSARRPSISPSGTCLRSCPGYTTLRGFAAQLTEFEESPIFQPALIEIEDALVPGVVSIGGMASLVQWAVMSVSSFAYPLNAYAGAAANHDRLGCFPCRDSKSAHHAFARYIYRRNVGLHPFDDFHITWYVLHLQT